MVGNVQGATAAAKGTHAQAMQQTTHHGRAHLHVKNQQPAQNTQVQTPPAAQAGKGGHINLMA